MHNKITSSTLLRAGLVLLLGTGLALTAQAPDTVEAKTKAKKKKKKKSIKLKDSKILPVGNAPFIGPRDAIVTIVEFSDFQCPFCSRGANIIKDLQKKYPNDVRVVFKHLPLSFHKEAEPAARAAIAAQKQGKFWEMHDKLFANQKSFRGADMTSLTEGFALNLELNIKKFRKDYNSSKTSKLVSSDLALASKVGARGTPNFFINGRQVVGALPLHKFTTVIEEEIKKANTELKKTKRKNIYAAMVKKNYNAPKVKPSPPKEGRTIPVAADDAMKGNTKKPLATVVIFSDFQCPYCEKINAKLETAAKKHKKHVRFVFKHMPLSFHKEAKPAAYAAIAAQNQKKFWKMHDKLFASQNTMGGNPELYIQLANELKLDLKKFEADMKSAATKDRVKRDIDLASKVGVRGTPTIFINGYKVMSTEFELSKTIDEEVKKGKALLKKNKKLKGNALYEELMKQNIGEHEKRLLKKKKEEAEKFARTLKQLKAGNSPIKGNPNAKIIIYEFTDLQCPYCKRADKTLEDVYSAYNGKVAIVAKNFPLAFHRQAKDAAIAALAAHRQGQYWTMRKLIFDNQHTMKTNPQLFLQLADQLGLDLDKFEKDINDPALAKQVDDDMKLGQSLGVTGTPNFFINGEAVKGAIPLNKFQKIIDSKLK